MMKSAADNCQLQICYPIWLLLFLENHLQNAPLSKRLARLADIVSNENPKKWWLLYRLRHIVIFPERQIGSYPLFCTATGVYKSSVMKRGKLLVEQRHESRQSGPVRCFTTKKMQLNEKHLISNKYDE